MKSTRVLVWLCVLSQLVASLAACSVPIVPSPAASPLRAVSPLLSPVAQPVVVVNRTNKPPVKMDVDLKAVVLTPADVKDLFPEASYSIQQPVSNADMRGLVATYPTQYLEHTTAFSEGFSTRVEVYKDATKAAQAYESIAAQQRGGPLTLSELGDDSRAWKENATSPDGQDLGKLEYIALVRQNNAVVILTFRTNDQAIATRLGNLVGVVLGRLSP
jgi:hypothetical protein